MRPLAGALRAPIQAMPAWSSARPTWVKLCLPVSCSASVGARFFRGDEDPVAVGVDRARQAVRRGRLGEDDEVAGGILGRPEGRAREPVGGVVDDADERGVRLVRPEPLVAAAVGLDHLALAGHALAPSAMAGGASSPDRGERCLGQDPPQGPFGHHEPLALAEQLGEMGPVGPGVGGPGELGQP
jgi:hypothetical protein